MSAGSREFSPTVQAVIDEFIPICHKLAQGRGKFAISIGGSLGKGTWDNRSDIDFRLFHEEELPWSNKELWKDCFAAMERWARQGVYIDGVWPRRIGEIDKALHRWMKGKVEPQEMMWTIWGYHLLTDIYNQFVIEDRFGVIENWKNQLKVYPPRLKQAILEKHMGSLRYWRRDYHYANKVERQDVVFLAGLSARLVHDILQVLFALNEVYFVGDGNNLGYTQGFALKPVDFELRVQGVLYPCLGEDQPLADILRAQRDRLSALIDDLETLIAPTG